MDRPATHRSLSLHCSKSSRTVPIFKELLPHLKAAVEMCPASREYLIRRWPLCSGSNLATQAKRYILAAGVEPWGKLWTNLRSTRATELVNAGLAKHVVAGCLGNTKEVLNENYLQSTRADIDRACAE